MLNKVILIGNVGSDPDIRTMPNGGRVANFSLATTIKSRKYTSQQDGVERNITEIVLQGYDSTIKLLDPRPQTTSENNNYQNNDSSANNSNEAPAETFDNDPVDDDIPF